MGNIFCSCCCCGTRHLDSVETQGSGTTRPLQSVVNDEVEDSEETVNVLGGSNSQKSSPSGSNEANLPPLNSRNHSKSPDQLAINLSQISSEDVDLSDPSHFYKVRSTSGERESEEPMLSKNVKPFSTTSTGQKHPNLETNPPASTDIDDRSQARLRLAPVEAADISLQENGTFHEADNSKDDIQLPQINNDFIDESEGPLSPTVDSTDELDSFYEKRNTIDVDERIRFFSQQSVSSTRSIKSENSEHESSKLNHFKKLGRATLVTDGTNSLLSSRAGRGGAHRNRKSAVTLSSRPEAQRDSYGSSKLTRDELQALSEAAKNSVKAKVSQVEGSKPSPSPSSSSSPPPTGNNNYLSTSPTSPHGTLNTIYG